MIPLPILQMGQSGQKLVAIAKDRRTREVVNISSFTDLTYIFYKPTGEPPVSVVASLDTDGTDGRAACIIPTNLLDATKIWAFRVRLVKSGEVLLSRRAYFYVES